MSLLGNNTGSVACRSLLRAALWGAGALALAGCWSSESIRPAVATPESAGFGMSSHTLNAGLTSASVIAVGTAALSVESPVATPDAIWTVSEPFKMKYCDDRSDQSTCKPVRFVPPSLPDIPRIIDPGGRGGFLIVQGQVSGMEGTTDSRRRFEHEAEMRAWRPDPTRGIWVTATFSLYYCSLQNGEPVCDQALLDGQPAPALPLATAVYQKSQGVWANAVWTQAFLPQRYARCEAIMGGKPTCATVKFEN
jgi:hypothetical protein